MQFNYVPYNNSVSDSDLLTDMIAVVKDNNLSALTMKQYKKFGKYSVDAICDRFGTWNNALIKANIDITQKFWSTEELFDNIENAWRTKGRQPSRRDMDDKTISHISSGAYLRKFGKWTIALQEFIEYINSDSDETGEFKIKNTRDVVGHVTKRDVNLRLRFKVLSRDNFTCCSCGASPAKDSNVELQIDHIVPWAKGGETTIENLQTLCTNCNYGKSDIV